MGRSKQSVIIIGIAATLTLIVSCSRTTTHSVPSWEAANPIEPVPTPPLGVGGKYKLTDLPDPPTPQRVRLGRWLFFDKRLSADDTVACDSCHHPDHAFADIVAVSIGIRGQQLTVGQPEGRAPVTRKAPSLINEAWTFAPNFFWDGRMNSLDVLDIQPIANRLAMDVPFDKMIQILKDNGYGSYFKEAFGTEEITKERVGKAIADYQRTRISGDSPYDRWKAGDANAVSEAVKRGDELFTGKAGCDQCHFGQAFTDSDFHNLGIGWDAKTKSYKDQGRILVTKQEKDRGSFKTPTLRDVALHPPYMHDGSVPTLRDVVEHYNKGGNPNPHLSVGIRPLKLSKDEVDDLVAWLEALTGKGYQDTPPTAFPQAAK